MGRISPKTEPTATGPAEAADTETPSKQGRIAKPTEALPTKGSTAAAASPKTEGGNGSEAAAKAIAQAA